MSRVRHCVQCPKCLTRYLVPFSPYRNGAYLIPTVEGSWEEYALYCSCELAPVISRWRWSEVTPCEVSRAAYERGYGTPEEILPVSKPDAWPLDVSRLLNHLRSAERRKDPRHV